jgi:hypothetical protein
MSLRFIGSLLVFLVPGIALAQAATVTITPSIGPNTQTIFNNEECEAELNDDVALFTVKVDFGVAVPAPGTTLTIKMGKECTSDTECLTIINEESLTTTVTDKSITLSIAEILEIIEETTCAGAELGGIDEQFKLFAEVKDSLDVSLGKDDTGDTDSLFIDTAKPFAALNLAAAGGEEALNVSWETNPDNDNDSALAQEASFRLECKLTDDLAADFVECGPEAVSGFSTTIDDLGGDPLENGVSVDVRVITIDFAGNESDPTDAEAGIPQDILDFGENFNGAEQGGCAVGHGEGQLLWIGFLIGVISLLRRNRDEALV